MEQVSRYRSWKRLANLPRIGDKHISEILLGPNYQLALASRTVGSPQFASPLPSGFCRFWGNVPRLTHY
jgi:hypothetical protein